MQKRRSHYLRRHGLSNENFKFPLIPFLYCLKYHQPA